MTALELQAAIARALIPLRQDLAELRRQNELFIAAVVVLASRSTDQTHVTAREAALIKGVPVSQIRKLYPLEVIPGTRRSGISLEKLLGGWLPLTTARAIVAREIEALGRRDDDERRLAS